MNIKQSFAYKIQYELISKFNKNEYQNSIRMNIKIQ